MCGVGTDGLEGDKNGEFAYDKNEEWNTSVVRVG